MPGLTPLKIAKDLEFIVDAQRIYSIGSKADSDELYHSLELAASYLRAIAAGEYKPVVHAHWNYTSRPNEDCMGGSHGVIECSHCKEDYGAEYDYCPSCGALMDGKDSDSVAKQA